MSIADDDAQHAGQTAIAALAADLEDNADTLTARHLRTYLGR